MIALVCILRRQATQCCNNGHTSDCSSFTARERFCYNNERKLFFVVSRRIRSVEGEEERRSPLEYQAQFQWREWTRTVDSRHSGGCAWASVSERVPYKSSRILLSLWHSLFERYSVSSPSSCSSYSSVFSETFSCSRN